MSKSKQIVICKGTSGLGNRILAACTAILYAEIVGDRVYIDWTEGNYAEAGTNAFTQFFEDRSPPFLAELSPETIDSTSVAPPVWRGKLDTSFGKLAKQLGANDNDEALSFDVAKTNLTEEVLVFCAYTHRIHKLRHLLSGDYSSWATLDNAEILHLALERFLVLKNPVKDLVETYKREHFTPKTIGVHVRYTDMKISVEDIIEKVRKVMGKDTHRQIFLATDSKDIIEHFQATFPGTIFAPKWFPEAGKRLHLQEHHDKFQIGVEALRDLYLLAECSSLVYSSRSSFGRIASLLSHAPVAQIYDIERPSLVARAKRRVKAELDRFLGRSR